MAQRVLYVAGPMRGYADFNFPAFDEAAARLRQAGYRVVSPADLDRACAFLPTDTPSVDRQLVARFLMRDLAEIAHVDGIALLDGWGSSAGVKVEVSMANALGIPVTSIETWIRTATAAATPEPASREKWMGDISDILQSIVKLCGRALSLAKLAKEDRNA